jgi:hypothetical protein
MLSRVRGLRKGSGSTLTPSGEAAIAAGAATLALAPHSFGASSTFEAVVHLFVYPEHCVEPGESLPTAYGRQAPTLIVDPDLPNAHRADLPDHERAISAEALTLFHRGVEDVRVGRVRALDPEELKFAEDDE